MVKEYYKTKNYQVRQSVGYLVRRCNKLVTAQIETLFVDQDISFVQYVILMNLRDNLVTTAAEISQITCHDSGAITRLLDALEQRGLIARSRNHQDRRVLNLEITPAGRVIAESLMPRVIGLYNQLLVGFTREEADMFVMLLTKFESSLMQSLKPDA